MTPLNEFPQPKESFLDPVAFQPTRVAGLERLRAFAPMTASHYAMRRNYVSGPDVFDTVSALSPWIRYRLITEAEVLEHVLVQHAPDAAMKFIQEVFWRGYFKGWLEQHPSVWSSYQADLKSAHNGLQQNMHRATDYQCAVQGRTGITCFDHWAQELQETGYLHNHVRMWFASIWIFTLRLPWELGADFFLRNLVDGDPASNTLSWRWVAGLHTKGKHYLARPDNIAKYTHGAFEPKDALAVSAEPLVENCDHPLVPLDLKAPCVPENALRLVTAEDCTSDITFSNATGGVLGLCCPRAEGESKRVHQFRCGAVNDALQRLAMPSAALETEDWTEAIICAAERAGTTHIATSFAPTGPIATKLAKIQKDLSTAGLSLHQQHCAYDQVTWPHATKGFFKLKKKLPQILAALGHSHAETS